MSGFDRASGSSKVMTRRMWIMLIVTLLVFGLVFGIKGFFNFMMNKGINESKPPAAVVSTAAAREDSWALSLEAVGTVRAINGVAVTTQVAGAVEKIHFESGQRVKAGEVLVTLDSSTDAAQYKALQAAARLAQLEFDRYKSLYQQGSISKSELDRKQSESDQAAASADAQRERLAQKTIRAPFNGELGIRQVDLGEYLNPGDAVVTLQQLNPIFVNFSLPEQNIDAIKEDLAVQVKLSAMPERVFQGRITAVEPGVDAATRNFNIQATLDNQENLLRPGMFATVEIRLASDRQVVVVPRTSVAYAPYGNAVFVVSEKEAPEGEEQQAAQEGEEGEGAARKEPSYVVKKRFVKLGPIRGDLIAITEGLKPGEVVATSGLLKLRNDAEVKQENDIEPPADPAPTPPNA